MVQPGFSGGSVRENLPANEGDVDSISGSGVSPGEGNGNPFQYSCLGKPQGQRSLVAYSPWGHKGIRHDLVTNQQQWYSHPTEYYIAIKNEPGASLVVWWLRLYTSKVGGEGLFPAGGTKIPHALQYSQKTKTKTVTTTTSKWMNSHRHYSWVKEARYQRAHTV